MPLWRTKSQSISLDFQKQESHHYKRLSVPAANQTQTQTAQKERSARPMEGRFQKLKVPATQTWSKNVDTDVVTHLALRHQWEQVECAPNWQNHTPASLQSCHPSLR